MSSAWLSVSALARFLDDDPRRAERCLGLWLAPRERATLDRLEVPKRRREWLAGRIAAKEVVRRRHRVTGDDALRAIEIAAPADGPTRGKPSYRIAGAPGPFDLSISHSGDHAVAALAAAPRERIGIDVERVEARAASFEELALSSSERADIARLDGDARAAAVTQRWVLKEALAKALGIGLRLRLEQVTVRLGAAPRLVFDASLAPGAAVHARVSRFGGACVATVILAGGAP